MDGLGLGLALVVRWTPNMLLNIKHNPGALQWSFIVANLMIFIFVCILIIVFGVGYVCYFSNPFFHFFVEYLDRSVWMWSPALPSVLILIH